MKRNRHRLIVPETINKDIFLEPYEEVCPKCKGYIWIYDEWLMRITCSRCKGLGKITWLDKIKGDK